MCLRAELGLPDPPSNSVGVAFSRDLYRRIDFKRLIDCINISIPPKRFCAYFLNFFEDLEGFLTVAQSSLLDQEFQRFFNDFVVAARGFEDETINSGHYDINYRDLCLKWLCEEGEEMPLNEYLAIVNPKVEAFDRLAKTAIAMVRYIAEAYSVSVHQR
ncbi:hypothetical protein D3C78_1371240 [compost metagenome]